jgi:ABC-type phosphate transport system ATPase subunit
MQAAQHLTLPQWLPVGVGSMYKLPGGIILVDYGTVTAAVQTVAVQQNISKVFQDRMMLNCSIILNHIYSRRQTTNTKPTAEVAHV